MDIVYMIGLYMYPRLSATRHSYVIITSFLSCLVRVVTQKVRTPIDGDIALVSTEWG